jgi:NADH-quinone oxidoreductase subunit G
VVLPVAAFAETSGTLVNLQGDRQSFAGAVAPVGEARPAWKVLRVLGNLANLEGFDFLSSEAVRERALEACRDLVPDNAARAGVEIRPQLKTGSALERVGGVPPYATDMLLRRATALQQAPDAWKNGLRICQALADRLGLGDGDTAIVRQDDGLANLPVSIDDRVPDNCVWLPSAVPGVETLPGAFGSVTLEKA